MRRLRKFLRLPSTDRNLLISAVLLLAATRYGLQLLPFRIIRRLLARPPQRARGCSQTNQSSREQIVWAVTVASKYMPSTCLSQALTAQVLLEKAGFSAHLRIGLVKGPDGQLRGHAWIESQGKVVIGALEDLSRYVTLPLQRERP